MKHVLKVGFAGEYSLFSQISNNAVVPPRKGEIVIYESIRYEVENVFWEFLPQRDSIEIEVIVTKKAR